MSRRKQARPIRVLESEDGLNNLSVLDLTNGGGSSEAESASGGSISESEDEDANDKTKLHDERMTENSATIDAVYERLKLVESFDAFPKLLDDEKKLAVPEDRFTEYDDCDDNGCAEDEDADEDNLLCSPRDDRDEDEVELKQSEDVDDDAATVKSKQEEENDNNNNNPDVYDERETDECDVSEGRGHVSSFPYGLPSSHVTLEALQNTKVAVAQFAATALANNTDNPAALQELAVLQSTLYTLHHQQLMQINLIQQLQHQLQIKSSTRSSSPLQSEPETASSSNVPIPLIVTRQSSPSPSILTPPKPSRTPTPIRQDLRAVSPPTSQPLLSTGSHQILKTSSSSPPLVNSQSLSLPPCSISSSFASSIITNLDPPPSPSEPNSLEMLKKRTQEVLDNASQGLLANNLADELAFRKSGSNGKGSSLSPYDTKNGGRNEPFFKHRCRYCGKVFGSDSALQIHIRSHTGERPFKCNVCGSRFTTKGNLKVHFQRHTSKFPHIKMNPNPVPEHLDKYHPPLLAQVNNHQNLPSGIPSSHPHSSIPLSSPGQQYPVSSSFPSGLPQLYRPAHPSHDLPLHTQHRLAHESLLKPLVPFPFFGTQIHEQDQPENLCKPVISNHSYSPPSLSENGDNFKKDLTEDEETQCLSDTSETAEYQRVSCNDEAVGDGDGDGGDNKILEVDTTDQTKNTDQDSESDVLDRCHSPYGECSIDSKYSNEDQQSPVGERDAANLTTQSEESLQEQPENLSNKSRSEINDLSLDSRKCYSQSSFPSPRLLSPASSLSSNSFDRYSSCTPLPFSNDSDPSKDPFLYTNFLPRPGSTDNSWENLIEINKTSETSKLQELVDNIGHKLTDPNECVVCHRILSCKSALQMHYRTHTGERPFRCKICGRSFTTKGNLKTHMGVHRIKPPVRVHHQCPVCHKRFTNSLILQQHIRLHTGEPTDLTPEQIQASEIKEYFPQLSSGNQPATLGYAPPKTLPSSPVRVGPVAPQCGKEYGNNCDNDKDERSEETKRPASGDSPPGFTTSLAALENHVRTVTTMSSHMAMVTMTQSFVNLCSKFSNGSPSDLNNDKSPGFRRTESPVYSEQLSPHSRHSVSPTLSTMGEDDTSSADAVINGTTSTPLDLTPKSSGSPSTTAIANITTTTSSIIITTTTTMTSSSLTGSIYSSNGSSFCFTSNSTSTNSTSPLISSVLTTPFNPLGLAVASSVRGNTTCNICYKTFACNSALEIHYRSHTKERPFKCTVCDRGFSTKGNMKQHMLTHKIRDMPSHLFEKSPGSVSIPSSLVDETSNTSTESKDTLPTSAASLHCVPFESLTLSLHKAPSSVSSLPTPVAESVVVPPQKRSPDSDSTLPVPKRQPSLPKHLCHVCNKNFSSSSALQIHMRTHTGDKPFRCTVCLKAFTTKGNLKVHMGTHMWTNGASRRGRRMSLELPSLPMSLELPSLPITNKDSHPDLFHRRPDLFYPYLPTPFLNGVHQKINI